MTPEAKLKLWDTWFRGGKYTPEKAAMDAAYVMNAFWKDDSE